MEDLYDRPITITSFKIVKEPSQYRDEVQDFTRIFFYYSDDSERIPHQCRTQSASLTKVLESIGNDMIERENGVSTMVCMERKGAKTRLWFDGLSDIY
jgi:hypothetical protein